MAEKKIKQLVKGVAYIPQWSVAHPSYLVNRHLTYGGIPSGSISQIQSSGEATFKTSTALQIIAQAQKQGLTCCFIDAEGALNSYQDNNGILRNGWFENLGVDISEMYIIDAQSGEQHWEDMYTLIEHYNVQLIIADSIHAIQPTRLHDNEIGNHIIGAHANLHTKGLLKLIPILRKYHASLIGINHKRVNMTVMGAMGEKAGGGKAWGFYSQYIFVHNRTTSKRKLEGKDIVDLSIYIEKNKGGISFIEEQTYAKQGYGIYGNGELAVLAEEQELVKKVGSWWKTVDNITIGQGDDALTQWAYENKDLILTTIP